MSDEAGVRCQTWLSALELNLKSRDFAGAAGLFEDGGFWRDLVSLTWNLHTASGRDSIRVMLETCYTFHSTFKSKK